MSYDLDMLIRTLEDLRNECGGSTPVRLAHQPSWPLAFNVANARFVDGDDQRPNAVWIASTQGPPYDENPYAPKAAWEEE